LYIKLTHYYYLLLLYVTTEPKTMAEEKTELAFDKQNNGLINVQRRVT